LILNILQKRKEKKSLCSTSATFFFMSKSRRGRANEIGFCFS